MIKYLSIVSIAAILIALVCTSCANSPGRVEANGQVMRPTQVMDFNVLYGENCAGCHGSHGKGGAAIPLSDPVFLAIADDATIRRIAANGVPGTPMPAFAQSAGGMLTDKQIDAIVTGIRSRWAKPDALRGANSPTYRAQNPGDPAHGAAVYATYCSSCHGPDGRGGEKASSIVDGSYLALVSDQDLRTNVIVGRPELGAPDWRGDVPGKPMSGQEISDVVAWLAAQRPKVPGQPYPTSSTKAAEGEHP
jgi:cytochrome c oxidase cbb3-type subunit III